MTSLRSNSLPAGGPGLHASSATCTLYPHHNRLCNIDSRLATQTAVFVTQTAISIYSVLRNLLCCQACQHWLSPEESNTCEKSSRGVPPSPLPRQSRPSRCYNWEWTDAMPTRHPILPALLLLCSPLANAQFTGPNPIPKPLPPPPRPVLIPNPVQNLASPYADPCEANAAKVDFDTCYNDQFKVADQDLNRLYRNAMLAFQADVADAHKRKDESQLSYDAVALFDLKAAQDA